MLIKLGYRYVDWQEGIKNPILWNTKIVPHLLISGITGGSKTVSSQMIVNQILDNKGGLVNMFVLRKILKLLLLPVAFVLFFTRWALETSVKLTEWAVGLLTLIVGAAIIYSIVIHRWGDLFLYSLIFAGIMAILMAVVVVQDFCDAMLDKISML